MYLSYYSNCDNMDGPGHGTKINITNKLSMQYLQHI